MKPEPWCEYSFGIGGVVMKKEDQKKTISVVSILLGIAAVASTLAYLLYRAHAKKVYEEKWRDYEDCGI